jgi:putative SOS response-associated peptidase YedK
MAEIHNSKKRMPLVLSADEEEVWLNGRLDLNQISKRDSIQLEAWEINKKVILGPNANAVEVSQKFCNFSSEQRSLFD